MQPVEEGIFILSLEITERKLAADALAADATRRRILIENSWDGIVVIDQDGKVFEANRRFADMLGYSVEEAHNLRVWDWDCLWTQDRVLQSLQRRGSEGDYFETRHRRKNGTEFDAEVSTNAAELGGRLLIFCVCRDITERKRLREQFLQSQKLEAVGQLAGGVAHDFNNILAAIMMHLGLLKQKSTLDAETRQSLDDMEAAAKRAASLTRQLLMFSRRSVLNTTPLDLNEVVGNLLRMLRRLIGEQIDLRFDGKTGLPLVDADAGMIEQVLLNLIVNARDAMPRGGRITISTAVAEFIDMDPLLNPDRRPGAFVCLASSDTGSGMDTATMEHIFEPFFTTKEAGKGTGLGLATVHGIVAQHKGWIEVESTIGHGSTFRVYLPALREKLKPIPEEKSEAALAEGKETILLVEDEPNVRQMVSHVLGTLGYRVHTAANGKEAIELWNVYGNQIDLLFTDMVMPEGITGLELVERLRKLKPGLTSIISSGYSAEITHAGTLNAAGVVYLPKPYEARVLAATVRSCLDQKK
jgi:PAS domain S-box-containing protein